MTTETVEQTPAATAPSAAPTSSADAPVSVATPTNTEADPNVKGSAAAITQEINAQEIAKLSPPPEETKPEEKPADKPAEVKPEFAPIKYSVDGKDHEIKSDAQHKSLLQQGHKYGAERRAHLNLQRQYEPLEQVVSADPEFGTLLGKMSVDEEMRQIAKAIFSGNASQYPALLAAIQNGAPLVNEDRIKAAVLQRQIDGQASTQQQEADRAEKANQLAAAAEKYGYKFDYSGNTPESNERFSRIQKIAAEEKVGYGTAFEIDRIRTGEEARSAAERATKEAAEKAAADAAEAKKKLAGNQQKISAASGFSGGAPKSKTSPKKGSDETLLASFDADLRRSFGG